MRTILKPFIIRDGVSSRPMSANRVERVISWPFWQFILTHVYYGYGITRTLRLIGELATMRSSGPTYGMTWRER